MAVNITVFPYLSPRVIQVDAPQTEVTLQDLIDAIRDWEDGPQGQYFDYLIDAAGKEDLGGSVSVGITATLQNAQVYFPSRSTPVDTAQTCTTADSDGIVLISSGSTFVTDGLARGDAVFNSTTWAMATIISVDSETQLTTLPLTGGSRNDWQVGDGIRTYLNPQGSISGGNLVAVDDVGASIEAVLQSPLMQVVRTSSASATLQELADIQFSSFQGGVWYDDVNGVSGVTYPTGTERQPVDNFTDALTIAGERGFNTFFIRGDATVDAGLDYTDYVFEGQGQNLTTFTVTSAAIVTNATFLHGTLIGTLDGDSQVEDCIIDNLDFVSGVIENCILNPSTITLGGSETAHFIDCESGVPGTGTPVIDCGGSGQPLAMRGYNGGVKLINKTGTESASIDLASGQVRIDLTTVTNGTIVVRGVGKVVDDSDDSTLVSGTYGSLTLINETVSGIMVQEIYRILGLDPDSPMTVTPTSRVAGDISQTISGDGETTTTVTRN